MSGAIEARLGEKLRKRKMSLALAESCTGGLIGHRITQIPGASDYFLGGIVAYSNRAKEQILGVQAKTLEAHGAVSEATAIEMAQGARRLFSSDLGLSVTGIAGPSSDSSEKPIGLTWIAVSTAKGAWSQSHRWGGDRTTNKEQSASAALHFLEEHLEES